MTVRIAVLGGSAVSTVQLVDALAAWPGGRDRHPGRIDLVLHGRSDRLEAVASACGIRADDMRLPVSVRPERDLAAALDGAHVVLNQIRVGGLEARAVDESFPQEHGLPGEETMGPGGFSCAWRTIPALRPVWAEVAHRAPGALIVNLTNPAGIVQQAARGEFGLDVVSVCDSPLTLLHAVASSLGLDEDLARRRYVGMNHVGWYVPAGPEELDRLPGESLGYDPELARLHQAVPVAYLRYYAWPGRMLARQRGRPTRAAELLEMRGDTADSYRRGLVPSAWPRQAPWYSLAVLPLLDGWLNGSRQVLIAGLPNGDRVPWLPPDVIVEGPVLARKPGFLEPQPVPELPDVPRGLLSQHAVYERLTVRALTGPPAALAVSRALMANPMVTSADQAGEVTAAILGLAEDHGPQAS